MTLDDRLKRAVDTLGDRLRDEITRELRMVTEELSAEAQAEREAARQAAIAAATPTPPQESEGHRLLDAIRALDEAHSLTDVLDVLVARAATDASRSGVLLVRGGRAIGWRDEQRLDLPLAETGVVADAVRMGFAASTAANGAAVPPFGDAEAGVELHAIPMSLAGDVVAVLYAQGGDVRTLEILARHASRVLEALTAFKTARAIAGAPASAASPVAEEPAANDDETAARRYARLLISEIKLYHQDAVEAGQRDRDLYQRLGGEIARARSLYEERVPSQVRAYTDYFRDELVRTLAGGDASLLSDVSAA